MFRVLKLAHFLGLVAFLGSILTFILISTLAEGSSLQNLAFARGIVSTGTNVLTLPGMWLLALTGVWIGYKRYGFSQRFVHLKLFVMALVVVNAHFFIAPAVDSATEAANLSLAQGHLLPEYNTAYLRESIFGAINVLLTLIAAVIGIWKIGVKPANG